MGWKTALIIINKPSKVNHEELLKDIGIKRFCKSADSTFDNMIGLFTSRIYIGEYRDNLIIYEWGLVERIIEKDDKDSEKLLTKKFPDSEICVIELVSTVGFWGYKVFDKGKLIRHRAGDSEKGTYIDSGTPLDEERELLSKSSIDGSGHRLYKFDDQTDEVLSEDQVGENFVFEICRRYFGESLDTAEHLLYYTNFVGYRKKAWWRFW